MGKHTPTQERGAKMTAKHALSLYANHNAWLTERLLKDEKCDCGACYLCAYHFLKARADAFHSPEGREIPTEQIEVGLVWALIDLLQQIPPEYYPSDEARALLSKLEPVE